MMYYERGVTRWNLFASHNQFKSGGCAVRGRWYVVRSFSVLITQKICFTMEANRSKLPSLMLLCTIFGLMLYQQIDNAAAFTSVVVCRAFCSSKINANPYECATSPKKAQQSLFVLQKEKSATETSTASSGSSKSSTVTEGAGAAGDKERKESSNTSSSSDGLPWWWKYVWDLDMMKRGEPGTDIILGDSAHVLRTNIEQIYGGYPSLDGCPMAAGEITDIAEGTMFIGLQRYNQQFGSPFKFCFGPKSFLTVSDPVQMKHILRDANTKYDKGILAEILKPIMGKGLIPADPETW